MTPSVAREAHSRPASSTTASTTVARDRPGRSIFWVGSCIVLYLSSPGPSGVGPVALELGGRGGAPGAAAAAGPLEGALAFQAGLLVEVAIELLLGRGEGLPAPGLDDPRRLEELLQGEAGGHPAVEDRGERRDELRQQRARRQDVAHHADGRPGVQQAAQAGPRVVADIAADLRLAGGDRLAAQGHGDLAVVVAQVAVGGDGAEVDPLADVGVPQEAIV